MALTTTTLSTAVGISDTSIVVASATGFAANSRIVIDQENMSVVNSYVSGTTIPVLRGKDGTATQAHVKTANVTVGLASDFASPSPQENVTYPIAGKARTLISITATSTLTLPPAGSDALIVLNGTSVITLTIPVPTKDMDGTELSVVSNGAAAHLLTFTGGLSGAGTSYDVFTINATAPSAIKVVACNGLWVAYCQPAMGGTVTNLIGTIA